MSHSMGTVYDTNGNVVAYFEYNGTSDVAVSHLCTTRDEVWETWREKTWRDCECGLQPQAAVLHSEYGGGFSWASRVCLNCRAIINPVPYMDDTMTHDGEPFPNGPEGPRLITSLV